MNSNERASLVDFIFKHIALYVFIPVFIVSTGIAYYLYDTALDNVFNPIDHALASMQQTSSQIEDNLDAIRNLINDMATTRDMLDDPERLHDFFYSITDTLPYIYGAGYAFTEHGDFGEYLHLTNHDGVTTELMSKVYATHNTHYRNRPWFTRAIASGKPVIIQTSQNIFGPSVSLVTYSFPIIIQGKTMAIGVLDVPMSAFKDALMKLKGISRDSFDSITIYYKSTPSDNIADVSFFDILHSNHPVSDATTLSELKKINSGEKNNTWAFANHYLFKKVSYLKNGSTIIIRFDIVGVFFLTILWLISTALLFYFISKHLRNSLVNKLTAVTTPIAQLSSNAHNLALFNFKITHNEIPKITNIIEVDHLICSLEQMRHNMQMLLIKEKQLKKNQGELELASRIQQKFIHPSYSSDTKYGNIHLQIEAKLQAENLLSGDIYDCIMKENVVYIFIGDATGKDITAAIFSSFVLAHFKILCDLQQNPGATLTRLNDYLCSMDAEDMFISAVCLKIDLTQNTLEFAIAGHDFPIIHNHDNKLIALTQTEPDLVLGVLPECQYHNYSISLNQCKHIFLFTDGITESMDEHHQLLGVDRLEKLIRLNLEAEISETSLCQAILQFCHQFESAHHKSDDKTVISIRLRPSDSIPEELCSGG